MTTATAIVIFVRRRILKEISFATSSSSHLARLRIHLRMYWIYITLLSAACFKQNGHVIYGI
jgi:hypothetical protein